MKVEVVINKKVPFSTPTKTVRSVSPEVPFEGEEGDDSYEAAEP